MNIKVTLIAALAFISFSSLAQDKVIKLYEGKAPGSEKWTQKEAQQYNELFKTEVVFNVTDPTLLMYAPAKGIKNTGTAIVIAPGGGFQSLSINREGIELAKWLSQRGITAFVLKYRLTETKTNDPAKEMMDRLKDRDAFDKSNAAIIALAAQDGKTALKYIRDNSASIGIDTKKIGIIGFSAGSTVAMETVLANTPDNLPDFAASIYGGPRKELLDAAIPQKQIPLFVCAATDDQLKLAPRSIDLYSKWLAAGYPTELHMYSKGGHGFGMGKQNLPVDSWMNCFEDWLKLSGYLN